MAQEGVAAALKLDSKTIEDLKTAQGTIEKMSDASVKLAESFEKVSGSVTTMAEKMKGTGATFSAAFDASGALRSISLIGETVTKVAQKSSAVKQSIADYTTKIDDIRNRLSDLYNYANLQKQGLVRMSPEDIERNKQEIESLKEQLGKLLDARKAALGGNLTKQQVGEFNEYIKSLTAANDGLKQMKTYYKDLEKEAAKLAKEEDKYYKEMDAAGKIARKASGILGVNPSNVDQMLEKLRQLKAVKRELEKDQNGKGLINPTYLQQVNAQIARTTAGIKQVNATLRETSTSASMVRTLLMTAFSPFIVQRFLSEMIKVRGEFELAQRSLAVIIQDANTAGAMFNEITKIAVRSPFSVQELFQQTKQLAAYRIETNKLIETTKMLGDISAGVGVDMQRLILAYGQVKAAEFLKGTELRQFSEAGVNMLGGLAERFTEIYNRTVSVGEVMQMVSKRMVKFADVEAVLKKTTELGGAFYKMQEIQADTIQGRISNLNDRIQIMFNNIGKGHDAFIKGVITGLESIISHWQALASIMEPLIVFMLVKGTAGLIGLTKAGKMITATVANMRGNFIATGRELTALNRVAIGFKGTVASIGAIIKQNWLGILIYIGMVLVDIIAKMNQLRKTLNEIGAEAATNLNSQITRFEKLLDIAADTNNKLEDRQTALDKLKAEYGNILNIQKLELDNVQELNDARREQIELIRVQAYEEARAKAINEAMSESQKKAESRAKSLRNEMVRGNAKGYGFDRDKVDIGVQLLENSDYEHIENKVSAAILDGTVKGTLEAGKFALKEAWTIAGRSEEEIKNGIDNLSEYFIRQIGGAFGDVIKQAKMIDDAIAKVPGETIAKAKLPYLDLIKTLSQAKAEFDKNNKKEEYSFNPALKEKDFIEYLKGVRDGIKKQIDNGALGDIEDFMKDELNTALENAFKAAANEGGDVEKAIRDVQDRVAKKFGKVGTSVIGEGILKYETGQTVSDYIGNINKELEQAIGAAEEWVKLQELIKQGKTTGAAPRMVELLRQFGSKEELQAYINMLKELRAELGATEDVKTKNKGASSYKTDLNTFLTALRNARKELDKLSDEGDVKYLEKLAALGKKVSISLGDDFKATDEQVMTLIEKYKSKLDTKDRIDIELNLITDKAEDKLKAYSDLVSDLWDRYENSKKMQDWGLSPTEGTTSEVMDEIKAIEKYLRDSGLGDEAVKLAKDIAERRVQIARTEQEEVAKIMYDANTKSLDKIEQAYKEMIENVSRIRTWDNEEEKTVAINNQIAKSTRDIADAQWDAYKSTEAYALAFGDLSGMSDELLASLKANLEYWLQLPEGALNPTEIQAIVKNIKRIEDQAGNNEVSSFFGAIATGLREIGKARSALKDLPELSGKVAEAQKEYFEALNREREARAAYAAEQTNENFIEMTAAVQESAIAEKELTDATNNFNSAQTRANKAMKNSTARMQQIENAYSQVGNVIDDTIKLVEDMADAFGLPISDDVKVGIESFTKGFKLVGQAISLATAAMAAYNTMETITLKTGEKLIATLTPFIGPLIAAFAVVGSIIAAITIKENRLKKQVEEHKDVVEKLEKAYDRLQKAMDKAINVSRLRSSFAEMNANLIKQRNELEEAIAANGQRKQTDEVKKETEELSEQISEVKDKLVELKDEFYEMLGLSTDSQGTAKSWSSDWLSAFKETGNGLKSLRDDFEKLYDDIVVGQLWSSVMGDHIEEVQNAIKKALADGRISNMEAETIRSYKEMLYDWNRQLEGEARRLGVSSGSVSENTLHRGVQTVTEQTASAVESILNTTNYNVSDTNAKVTNIEIALTGEGENTIISQLKSQTRYLADIARIASAVYYPGGHPKGAGALKVITEMA